MHQSSSSLLLLLCALCSCLQACHASAADPPVVSADGWRLGRATFYGGPTYFTDAFAARGDGAFGELAYGSCGYYQQSYDQQITEQSIPYPPDAVAALATTDADYPGSCEPCYQVRCKDGPVLGNGTEALTVYDFYYLPTVDPYVLDDYGCSWPGRPAGSGNNATVECWNNTGHITVTIIDSCPCQQRLPGEVRTQEWCCGDEYHFDLSFRAFERLAHPLYGAMMLEFRPVDCLSGQPLSFLPGYVDPQIYGGRVNAGWGYRPFGQQYDNFWAQGAGLYGGNATCLSTTKDGGIGFTCRECGLPGYQPLSAHNASSLEFWIRSDSNSSDIYFSSTPRGQVPPLKVYLENAESVENGSETSYCTQVIYLNETQPVDSLNSTWYKFSLPLSDFGCTGMNGTLSLSEVTGVGWQKPNERNAYFCLDDIILVPDALLVNTMSLTALAPQVVSYAGG